jgi:hypothetical protein
LFVPNVVEVTSQRLWHTKRRRDKTYLLCEIKVIAIYVCLVAQSQVAQLVALMEDVVADRPVDDGGHQNAEPDRQVVSKDAQFVVRIGNPAP